MLTTLNNFIKYSFTIRTFIQILYDFRIRKAFDLLRIENTDVMKTKTVTIIIYSIIIKNVIVETSPAIKTPSINRRKISSLEMIISIKSSTSISVEKSIFFIKELISPQAINASHIVNMNEFR